MGCADDGLAPHHRSTRQSETSEAAHEADGVGSHLPKAEAERGCA